ncbi:meprin A subunit beta-like [Mastacembelus armatus]|uniref:Metalloendopeptidase n=1 Tax=Mastacembelus armatus TaxID=205130 RepID=A0A3Q3RTW2_9TELE|nr:meprin A subunit beta-like [Mastacembelus armatus]
MYVIAPLLVSLIVQRSSTLPVSCVGATEGNGDEETDLDIDEINIGLNLYEGDIKQMTGRVRNMLLEDQYRWEIPVPYVFDESLELNARGVVLQAFDQIRLKTCIDFKPWGNEPNYIVVMKDDGCWSYVGNQRQGNQSLSIGQWCDHLAIVEHEFLHALGFWHEQSRYDRDDHVTIIWENIEEGMESNFVKHDRNYTTTLGTMYDYTSVMHYGKDTFSNGNGSTIITNVPEYQNVIGQRIEMSSNDILKLQKLYNCTSAVTFLASCSFEDESLCDMTLCAAGNLSWQRVSSTKAGPLSDHTSLSSQEENQMEFVDGNDTTNQIGGGFFMHCSTASGKEGHGAKMQSRRMNPKRQFQCLQFFYFHSGSDEDQFNIWIREYDREDKESTYLMGQIIGPPTSHWHLHHIPLNATRSFQVEFEVRKGPGNSSGGVSIDDINLFEMECPHHVWHIPNFDQFLINSSVGTDLLSPRFLTRQSYGVQILLHLYADHFGVFFRLVSTDHDDELQWPCERKQITISLLDQSHHIQLRMSKQISITTDSEKTFAGENGETFYYWDNPRKLGHLVNNTNTETYYAGPNFGYRKFLYYDAFWSGNFIKGGSVYFLFSFDDLSHLLLNLPKPHIWPNFNHVALMQADDKGVCLNQLMGNTTAIVQSFSQSHSSFAVSLHTGTMLFMLTASGALMVGNLPMAL